MFLNLVLLLFDLLMMIVSYITAEEAISCYSMRSFKNNNTTLKTSVIYLHCTITSKNLNRKF